MIWRFGGLIATIFLLLLAAVINSRQSGVQTEHLSAAVWVSIFSAVIAGVAAIISSFSAREAVRKGERESVEFQLKYFENFRKWSEMSALSLTEAIHLCDLEPNLVVGESFFDRRHRLRIEISNQTDTGRWFFPNIEIDEFGAHKEIGFRGYRHEVLNGLVIAYRCLGRMDYQNKDNNHHIRLKLINAKRHFIGQVQRILDPAEQQKEFERIAGRPPETAN